jgi:hypothetical protein
MVDIRASIGNSGGGDGTVGRIFHNGAELAELDSGVTNGGLGKSANLSATATVAVGDFLDFAIDADGSGQLAVGGIDTIRDEQDGSTFVIQIRRVGAASGDFRRGDTDGSRAVNITDMIRILNFLFAGGPAPTCQDTADTDDSGGLNITDGIYGLNFLFAGGRPIPAPGPTTCGPDPTADELPACVYEC